MNEFLTVEDVAARLKIARKTLCAWRRTGKWPAVELGNRWLIRGQDLEATAETHLHPGTEAQPREPVPQPSPAAARP